MSVRVWSAFFQNCVVRVLAKIDHSKAIAQCTKRILSER